MKILQVTDTFVPSDFGGVKVVSYNISKALAKRGHEITVYTTDANVGRSRLRNIKHKMNMDGFNVRYFKNLSNFLAFKYRLFIPFGVNSALRKEISNFDVIHLHSFRSFQHIIVYYYAKKYKVPYVLQAHGSVLPFFSNEQLKNLYDRVWGYRILKDASKVIALTKTEAEQYKKMGVDENKIEIVPNGIDRSKYENLPDKGIFRQKYGIKSNEKIVLFLGRLHRIKGVDLLVEAFSDLAPKMEGGKLVIAGPDDGFLSTLKAQIEDLKIDDDILFTGPLYGMDKLEAYVDADVYVLPSVYEIFGVTLLEACACGTPVIVTDRCGIADVIDKRVGYVVKYDKEQLQDAVFKMLSDDGVRRRFGEEGKRMVRDEFGWDKIVYQMEEVYLRLVRSN